MKSGSFKEFLIMEKAPSSRRKFFKNAVGGVGLMTIPGLLQAQEVSASNQRKIVVIGGHPDDPE